MNATYVSQETGEKVTIECRFCWKFDDKHVPAVAVAGQWEGGDPDEEPHWVPVCDQHLAGWHFDRISPPSGHGPDDEVPIPEESRLPTLPLPKEDRSMTERSTNRKALDGACPRCGTVNPPNTGKCGGCGYRAEAEYQVTYTVPVVAHVVIDEDGTGRVVRVVELNDEITLDADEHAGVTDAEGVAVPEDEAEAAIRIADSEEWPAWDRGY